MAGPQLTPGEWNFTIYQGSTFERTLRIEDLAPLADYSWRGQIRKDSRACKKLADMTFVVTANDAVTMTMSANVTADIPAGRWVHDIEIYTPSDGYVQRVLSGKVTVVAEVTK